MPTLYSFLRSRLIPIFPQQTGKIFRCTEYITGKAEESIGQERYKKYDMEDVD